MVVITGPYPSLRQCGLFLEQQDAEARDAASDAQRALSSQRHQSSMLHADHFSAIVQVCMEPEADQGV